MRREIEDQPEITTGGSPYQTGSEPALRTRSEKTVEEIEMQSLKVVASKKSAGRIARVVIFMLVLTVLVLWFVPWQQTIVGSGQVVVFDPNSRPQTVEAQIPGRIKEWYIQEGQVVQKGDPLALIEDIDSKFLDPKIVERSNQQATELENVRTAENSRAARIEAQIGEIRGSRDQQLRNARERITQAKNRRNAAVASVEQAKKNLTAFIKVARASAEQRKLQAQDIVRQNEQSLIAAKQQRDIERINFDRIKFLYSEGLESKRAYELAETSKISAETRVQAIEDAIQAAKRVVELGSLGEEQAEIDIARQRDVVRQAQETVNASERDVAIAENDVVRIDNDTNATLASLEAQLQAVQSSISKAGSDIQKIQVEVANVEARRKQAKIFAPATGRVVRVEKFGTGSTVKAGDVLMTIAPETKDRVVSILVSDNDVSFIQVGRPVRIQFAGYPAVQFAGFPGLSIGTFGGRVAFIDPIDDGGPVYRVIVKEDLQTLPSGKQDQGWPTASNLRPGAEAVGWIMLDTVPLGFELWRQFNGFPVNRLKKEPRLGSKPKEDEEEKSDKKGMSPTIKVKSK